MTEDEYWRYCLYIIGEINYAAGIFELQEEINRLVSSDEAICKMLNDDALFWKIQEHSLQMSLFITLGRIFDEDENACSIHRVLKETLKHKEFFSKNALAARKCVGGTKLDSDTWNPNTQELRLLKKALATQAKKFTEIYRPIRHQVYAHSIVIDETEVELFKKTNRAEVKNILEFLRELIAVIEDLYLNGRKPVLGRIENPYGYPEEIRQSVNCVLSKLAKNSS
jgi:hypothetical protein